MNEARETPAAAQPAEDAMSDERIRELAKLTAYDDDAEGDGSGVCIFGPEHLLKFARRLLAAQPSTGAQGEATITVTTHAPNCSFRKTRHVPRGDPSAAPAPVASLKDIQFDGPDDPHAPVAQMSGGAREAFEKWLRSHWTEGYACPKNDDGTYLHLEAQDYWECWQAASQPSNAVPSEQAAYIEKLETIIGAAYQFAGNHDAPVLWLDVLSDPAAATAEQVDALLPYFSAVSNAVQDAPAAWIHEEDSNRVISAAQKEQALRDGGASASSVKPYSIAAVVPVATVPPVVQAPIDLSKLRRFAAFTIEDGIYEHHLGEYVLFGDVQDLLANAAPAIDVRDAALEEAAKICEQLGDEYDEREGRKYPELRTDAVSGCRDCESAIRALQSPPQTGKESP